MRAERFVAYFQPGTNTYGPIDRLRPAYQQALAHPDVVGLAVGTRPDCVGEDVLDLLAELAEQTWVVVEYGLQTIHDRTLDLLNRGHHYDAFLDAYRRSRRRNLDVGVHVILGLPGESPRRHAGHRPGTGPTGDPLGQAPQPVRGAEHRVGRAGGGRPGAAARVSGIRRATWSIFWKSLPGRVVIERLCGDAPPEYLVGPQWCLDKAAVRAAVEAEFRRRGTWQGCKANDARRRMKR